MVLLMKLWWVKRKILQQLFILILQSKVKLSDCYLHASYAIRVLFIRNFKYKIASTYCTLQKKDAQLLNNLQSL